MANNNTQRHRTNVISLLITLGILFVAVKLSDGSFATRINKISENLDRALAEIINERRTDFTELTDNATYVSDPVFNPRGMAGLYNLTLSFMDVIMSKDIYPEGFFKVENNNIVIGDYQTEWKSLLLKYSGILAMVIIVLVLVVFFPLCGFCFCCCRCCGRCGSRSQPFDKKHDLCKKIVLATFLIGLGTLLLFGVVCAFVSNEHMQEGIDDLTDNLKKGIKDVNTYLDTTSNQVDTLLNQNYKEFTGVLLDTIRDSSDIVFNNLANYTKAVSMTQLANVVKSLPNISDDFVTLKYSTFSLRVYASQLNDAVRQVKKDLLHTLQSDPCSRLPKCSQIQADISNLQTNIHFNTLPDISEQISVLDNFEQNKDLIDAVNKGQETLLNIKNNIADVVNTSLDKAEYQINEAGKEIKKGSADIKNLVDDLKKQIDDNTKPVLDSADTYIKKYAPYRYYIALAISCVLLLISLCVALGLICGICGKRPDGYGDDCCNKGSGSQFLICGVMIMFISGFLIAVVILVSFLLGIISQRIVCDPMRDPQHSQVFDLIDKVNFSAYHVDFNISDALASCYKNESIYNVLRLENRFNLTEVQNYLTTYNITNILQQIDLSSINLTITLLDQNDKEELQRLAKSGFADINFYEFSSLLDRNFTTVSLSDLSNELSQLIEQIENSGASNTEEIIADLRLSRLHIDTYQEKIVMPMIENATAVVELVNKLENDLKLNHSSFEAAIEDMLQEVNDTEVVLRDAGQQLLQNVTTNFTSGIIAQVQTYLDRVCNKTQTEVGKCGPLSLVIHGTLTSTCDKILLPWNGFWFGLFWSVLLFIPTILVSVKLATLYQKYSPYSGPLVEAEYLCETYGDRDNIPLNSRNGKVKKKNKKYKRYEDRPLPSPAGDVVAREYTAGTHQDARYADMAPKHWEEFPAGGPPQYQRAPTEYERPPPYYYPGAGESHQ